MAVAKIDQNGRATLIALSSAEDGSIVELYADPITHRLLVDLPSGAGTVTSVSVVTANGISGTVATATTTPAITLTLGAITPSAVQISGLTASEIVGTDASKNLVSLAVATYPSLTELSYVKGVTSAIQTQINAKGVGTVTSVTSANGAATVATTTTTPVITIVSAPILTTTRTIWGQNFNGSANVTGTLALGASDLTLTGSIGATGARATKVWTAALEVTTLAALTVGGTAILTSLTAPQFTTIELGDASDTTLSRSAAGVLAVEGVVIPSISSTNTLTNKRINPRLVTAASYTTDTGSSLDTSTCDQFEITAQAGALLFNAPSGTPLGGQKLIIRIKDNGTARALTYNAIFRAMGNALPSTTVLSKTLYMGFIYNATDTKWDLVALAQEA